MLMDFTELRRRRKSYGGANGGKQSIEIDGEVFMLKLPGHARNNPRMSYAHSAVSEHLGSAIMSSCGLPAQETVLGTFTQGNKTYLAVACRDFTYPNLTLQDFASLKNQVVTSETGGYDTELSEIERSIEEQTLLDPSLVLNRFWDMFIVDALIGNWDRHNGNWGFLYNQETDELGLAPVFDCGSSLFPQADEDIMRKTLDDPAELELRVRGIPTSALKQDGKRVSYFDFITSLEHDNCNAALARMAPRIDMDKISALVTGIEGITELHRRFLIGILKARKEAIIDAAYARLMKS